MDSETKVPLTFIEVKKFEEITLMDFESDATAQTLREAHILLHVKASTARALRRYPLCLQILVCGCLPLQENVAKRLR